MESFLRQLVIHEYTLGWPLRRSGRERLKMIEISEPRFRGGRDRHLDQHRMCRRPGNSELISWDVIFPVFKGFFLNSG